MYGYRFTIDMEYVCRCFGLCRTEGWNGFDRTYILIFIYGTEVWRAFGGAAVMWILASFGYNTAEGAVQTAEALTGLNLLMSWIPAAVAVVAMIVVYFYPLTKKRVEEINKGLKKVRASD